MATTTSIYLGKMINLKNQRHQHPKYRSVAHICYTNNNERYIWSSLCSSKQIPPIMRYEICTLLAVECLPPGSIISHWYGVQQQQHTASKNLLLSVHDYCRTTIIFGAKFSTHMQVMSRHSVYTTHRDGLKLGPKWAL